MECSVQYHGIICGRVLAWRPLSRLTAPSRGRAGCMIIRVMMPVISRLRVGLCRCNHASVSWPSGSRRGVAHRYSGGPPAGGPCPRRSPSLADSAGSSP